MFWGHGWLNCCMCMQKQYKRHMIVGIWPMPTEMEMVWDGTWPPWTVSLLRHAVPLEINMQQLLSEFWGPGYREGLKLKQKLWSVSRKQRNWQLMRGTGSVGQMVRYRAAGRSWNGGLDRQTYPSCPIYECPHSPGYIHHLCITENYTKVYFIIQVPFTP